MRFTYISDNISHFKQRRDKLISKKKKKCYSLQFNGYNKRWFLLNSQFNINTFKLFSGVYN